MARIQSGRQTRRARHSQMGRALFSFSVSVTVFVQSNASVHKNAGKHFWTAQRPRRGERHGWRESNPADRLAEPSSPKRGEPFFCIFSLRDRICSIERLGSQKCRKAFLDRAAAPKGRAPRMARIQSGQQTRRAQQPQTG